MSTIARYAGSKLFARGLSSVAQLSAIKVPPVTNAPIKDFVAGSKDRELLASSIERLSNKDLNIPLIINGNRIFSDKNTINQVNPANHDQVLAKVSQASEQDVKEAIQASIDAKYEWSRAPWTDRAAVFLKAAELLTGKYRYDMLAATMLGQGKNIYQAEIDCITELADFFRFGVKYAEELYNTQPAESSPGIWNRAEYRPLEGFVYAVTPFNFTAISGNLIGAPALMGNTVVWKPSQSAVLSNYILYKILEESGLPNGVINFLPGDPIQVTKPVIQDPRFSALHYTGSTGVFVDLYKKIANNIENYAEYPRIVGETGGKNFHVIHESAAVDHAAISTLRGAFEYQGQKCSATSRVYISKSIWPEFKEKLIDLVEDISIGNTTSPHGLGYFMGPVIHEGSFDKLASAIEKGKQDPKLELITGGDYDKSKGYFVNPTIFVSKDINHVFFKQEFFGPLLTIYVYEDSEYENILTAVDSANKYGLTGSIFAQDREAVRLASDKLLYSAGNFYINDKSTGAVVGQQWFGGSRQSGTNDKSGSGNILSRFVTIRSIKENFVEATNYKYPHND